MASDSTCSLDVDDINKFASITPEPTSDSTLKSPYRALEPTQIRIVEILPGDFQQPIQLALKTIDLRDEPVYEALSYVWNPIDGTVDASKALELVTLKGSQDFAIQITANLDAAIRYLRQHKPPPCALWIDALCINQNLAEERNHQVGPMSKIYSSAKQVLIWLGPPFQDSAFAFETLSSGTLEKDVIGRFVAAVELLLRRDWFGRLWIAQELTLSRHDPTVHHGSQTMSWDSFAQSIEVLVRRIKGQRNGVTNGYLPEFTATNIRETSADHVGSHAPPVVAQAAAVLSLRDMRNAGFKARFGRRMLHTTYSRATDPRDRVYGLLGFSYFHKTSIIPDYKKPSWEVYSEAAVVIATENFSDYLEFLNGFELNPHINRRTSWDGSWGVSWFPDMASFALTRRPGPRIAPPGSVLQEALKISGIISPIFRFSNDRSLLTWGRILGKVAHYAVGGSDVVLSFARHYSGNLSSDDIVSAIMGFSSHDNLDKDSMVAFLEDYRKSEGRVNYLMTASRFGFRGSGHKSFIKLLDSCSQLTIFVIDTILFGIVPYWQPRGWKGLAVVGLFGIKLPFILNPMLDNTHQMVCMAHLGGHDLGDDSLTKTGLRTKMRVLTKMGLITKTGISIKTGLSTKTGFSMKTGLSTNSLGTQIDRVASHFRRGSGGGGGGGSGAKEFQAYGELRQFTLV